MSLGFRLKCNSAPILKGWKLLRVYDQQLRVGNYLVDIAKSDEILPEEEKPRAIHFPECFKHYTDQPDRFSKNPDWDRRVSESAQRQCSGRLMSENPGPNTERILLTEKLSSARRADHVPKIHSRLYHSLKVADFIRL